MAIDVHNGNVLAMVGGRNYAESQLNRTDARRQPGSVSSHLSTRPHLNQGSHRSRSSGMSRKLSVRRHDLFSANYGKAYSMHDVLLREGLVRSLMW